MTDQLKARLQAKQNNNKCKGVLSNIRTTEIIWSTLDKVVFFPTVVVCFENSNNCPHCVKTPILTMGVSIVITTELCEYTRVLYYCSYLFLNFELTQCYL